MDPIWRYKHIVLIKRRLVATGRVQLGERIDTHMSNKEISSLLNMPSPTSKLRDICTFMGVPYTKRIGRWCYSPPMGCYLKDRENRVTSSYSSISEFLDRLGFPKSYNRALCVHLRENRGLKISFPDEDRYLVLDRETLVEDIPVCRNNHINILLELFRRELPILSCLRCIALEYIPQLIPYTSREFSEMYRERYASLLCSHFRITHYPQIRARNRRKVQVKLIREDGVVTVLPSTGEVARFFQCNTGTITNCIRSGISIPHMNGHNYRLENHS